MSNLIQMKLTKDIEIVHHFQEHDDFFAKSNLPYISRKIISILKK